MRGVKYGWVGGTVLGVSLVWAATFQAQATKEQDRYHACIQLTQHDPAKALKQANDWERNGGDGGARHCEALALVGLGRYEDAATALQQLSNDVEISSTATKLGLSTGNILRAQLLSQAGNAWLMAKQFTSARSVLTDALKFVSAKSPMASDILVDRARAEGGDRDFNAALNDLDKAIAIDPGVPEVYIYRASAFRETHQIDLAAKDIETALMLDPGNLDALLERGYIRQVQKNYAGARADWERVADQAKGEPIAEQARTNLATLGPAESDGQDSSHSARTSGSDSPAK